MQTLLGPNGCPWDREQTLESRFVSTSSRRRSRSSMRSTRGKPEMLARGARGPPSAGRLSVCAYRGPRAGSTSTESSKRSRDKLVRRHPWVFGDEKVDDASGAIDSWEAIKAKEKKERGARRAAFQSLFQSLLRAVRIGEKASAVGYDWPDAGGPRAKIEEELRRARRGGRRTR